MAAVAGMFGLSDENNAGIYFTRHCQGKFEYIL
jgi:hypothetical protein